MIKMRNLLALLFAGVTLSVSAQKGPGKFGDVSIEDLKMTTYEADPSAEALVLFDYGIAHIDYHSEKMIFERHKRIKILKKEGLDWANASILLYHSGTSKEKVSGLKAVTYNLEDGKIVSEKMSNSGVFDERFNKYWDKQKFTLPNVKEGSVIEYSYKIYSDFIINFPNWEFQGTIPTLWSEYRATIPDFFIFKKYMQGYVTLSINDVKKIGKQSYSDEVHRWVAKDVPAFKPEPHMTSERDYISKMNFALSHINFPGQPVREIMGSWEKLNSKLLESEYFGKVIDGSGFLRKKTDELTAGATDQNQKIAKIYDYVKESIEWNRLDDHTVDETNLKKVFDAKKGNSAEINLALVSMLKKAGVNANPVILSTRDHGFVRQFIPMEKQFNYVICAVNIEGKTLLLDATDRLLPMGSIPERCLNGQGLIISQSMFGWLNLEAVVRSRTTVQADLVLEEDHLKGIVKFNRTGYDAHRIRKNYLTNGKEEYVKQLVGSKSWDISKSEITSIEKIDESVVESYEMDIADHINAAGNMIYIDPFITGKTTENPFKLEKREYPVDFGSPFDRIYIVSFTLPEGYQIEEAPEPKVMSLPANAGRYLYNVARNGNTITITSVLNINKAIFVQNEYEALREFYNLVVAKQAEQLVLKKKI